MESCRGADGGCAAAAAAAAELPLASPAARPEYLTT